MQKSQSELETRWNSITNEVKYGYFLRYSGHRTFTEPFLVPDVCDCNCIVILNGNVFGVSHHDLDSGEPGICITELLDLLAAHSPTKDLSAIVVAGDPDHFESNKNVLSQKGIPVIDSYNDDFRRPSPAECDLLDL